MKTKQLTALSLLAVLILVITACTRLVPDQESVVTMHPVDFKDLKRHATCTECHGAEDLIKGINKSYAAFNHNEAYYKNHSYYAYLGNNGDLCARCHVKSFCTDCHTTKAAMKPSDKNGDNIEFEFSHRGDYIARHKLDGALDPASCYKCHGRANNELCRDCHK